MRDFPDLRFLHGSKRCQGATKLWLAQTEKEVRLVFAWIDAFAQNRAILMVFDDRVMPGGDVIATERFGFLPKIAELQFLIAHYARIRRPTGLILAGKIIDDRALKLVRFIDNVMRNA